MKTTLYTMMFGAALLGVAPVETNAQAVEPGQRVRVRLVEQPYSVEGEAHPQLLRGTLVGITTDSVMLQVHPTADVTAIARTGVERFYVSRGVPSRFSSAFNTAVHYVPVAVIKRLIVAELHDLDESAGESALIGAATGAAFGAFVGALWPRERWRRIRSW